MNIAIVLGDWKRVPILFIIVREVFLNRYLDNFYCCRTELDFYGLVERGNPIDIAIISLMLPSGYNGIPEPDEVRDGGVENAGWRCAKALLATKPGTEIVFLNSFASLPNEVANELFSLGQIVDEFNIAAIITAVATAAAAMSNV